ncbi:hypothetical protein IGB42_02349 [Andreprevotia sp. IGB-42]|uniref:hypothetical protein n=1 Tax=Andreprevotia sp. IGB-42 TaxID=2497473 RepID=UPI00135792F2|nr:hypothetical protein [Andreprevotia sp. IGB-42]KAF0812954.1 hypothetical protein IGB42_02349 [Andreprevotia sp. IGB-42]
MKKLLVLLFGLTLHLAHAEDAPLPFDDPSSPAPVVRAQAEVGASHSRPAKNSVRKTGKGKHAAKPAKRTKATATAAKSKPAAGKSKPATKSATKAKGSKKPAAAKSAKKK